MDNPDAVKQKGADASISTFNSALVFNAVVGVAIFAAFCIVRRWNRKIYQPRTYLVKEDVRSPELPEGIFSWITASFRINDSELVNRIGLDAYMFVRFQRMCAMLFTAFALVAIPVIIPINLVNGVNTVETKGIVAMTIGNVPETQPWRLWFHLILTILFCSGAVAMLWREMQEYTRRRHAYLLSAKHQKTPQSTTILVTAIPKGINNERALKKIFDRFPGGVRSIWMNKNPEELIKLCEERDEVTLKLETAEYNYIRSAYGKPNKKDSEIKEPQRPIGRTSAIPFVGPKVDLIDVYSKRLSELNRQIEQIQQSGSSAALNSAFIQFNTQFAAHSAVQTVVYPTPFRMTPMFVEISPLDVVWKHMNLDTITKKGRSLVSTVAATALVLLWSIPVLFVSTIASIEALVEKLPFLSFMQTLPTWLFGIIQGILPPLFLAILMAILPIVLTMMATFEGHVRSSAIQRSLMSKYFFFLVVNVLLISTLSNGALKTFGDMKEDKFSPLLIVNKLAQELPGASTFFITYALLQSLTGPVMELLQIAPLVLNYLFTTLLAKSPRQIWNVQGRLNSVNYGLLFPPQALMFSIGLVYSTIAPLILPFVAFYFIMYYRVYRHQFLYVYKQPVETGGLAFPLAVKHAYTGIFITEVTVFGIFLLKGTSDAIPQLILLFLLIICTSFSLSNMNEAFDPLVTYLPMALFSEDLHIGRNGVVTEGDAKDAGAGTIEDEELAAAAGEKSSMIALQSLPPQDHRSEKDTLAVGKQEYDDVATVSSQLPAFPTPNPSEVDSASLSHHSHPQLPTTTAMSMDRQQQQQLAAQHQRGLAHEETFPQAETAEELELRRLQQQAYCHPALYKQQTPIWLPMDERGLVSEEIQRLAGMGIVIATTGAAIDPATAKATVQGIVFAPGEETQYRLEQGV
ncbi:hypothetical protein BGZ70_004166 [Mortierella alpina]|uniref:DUF221-domain-containing protein n=1 Tax=Mortierella alpina TaxID=64518 RepID=A0A9P6IRP4_MORAP|nr:hypothetical protein BGZ70_004166 [Mortierella alpina]